MRLLCVDIQGDHLSGNVRELCVDIHGDHLSGKPGNVREFDSCQRNVRHFTKNLGNVREKLPKTIYC